jgi:hypothetical protein
MASDHRRFRRTARPKKNPPTSRAATMMFDKT